MDFDMIAQIAAGVLFLASIVFGLKWKHAKALLKEVSEALTATSAALEDDDVTDIERRKLLKEWSDVITAAKSLIGK
uniref:Holin n=1 Tax=viral metagenome TaxID=1070528 RepID=A0A6M3KLC2_9ZZZZ